MIDRDGKCQEELKTLIVGSTPTVASNNNLASVED
jgi:hypothetical protein